MLSEKEVSAVKRIFEEKGLYAESIYIGGGTPTTLEPDQLDRLISRVEELFDMKNVAVNLPK